jgi:hypothetical protein
MTATDAKQFAHAAKRSDGLEALARLGLICFGVTHLLVAWIAAQIAFGNAPAEGDQVGAFQLVRQAPWGVVLLSVVAIGLAAMTIWQALEAAVGHHDVTDGTRTAERVASAGRAVVYAYLAYEAVQVVLHPAETGAQNKQEAAGSMLSSGPGQFLVGAIGVGIVGLSIGLAWYGLSRRFERHLRTGGMSRSTRRTVRWMGTVGYVAKAAAYGIVGVLVVTAAVNYDPAASRGLDAALRSLAQQPWGGWLLLVVAVGIGAYGVFGLAQARYRKV